MNVDEPVPYRLTGWTADDYSVLKDDYDRLVEENTALRATLARMMSGTAI